MKLTIRSIVKWEYLSKRSFFTFNGESESDVAMLLYVLCESDKTYVQWLGSDDGKDIDYHKLRNAVKVWGQYTPEAEGESGEGESVPEGAMKIGDMISDLALQGVSVEWLMDTATLSDVKLLRDAMERKQRYELEDKRLWSFLLISPHISTKKIKRPEDLLPFPWDVEREQVEMTNKEVEERIKAIRKEYYGES